MQRNALTLAQAQARIASQLSTAEKRAQAPPSHPLVILDNSSTPAAMYRQIDAAFLST